MASESSDFLTLSMEKPAWRRVLAALIKSLDETPRLVDSRRTSSLTPLMVEAESPPTCLKRLSSFWYSTDCLTPSARTELTSENERVTTTNAANLFPLTSIWRANASMELIAVLLFFVIDLRLLFTFADEELNLFVALDTLLTEAAILLMEVCAVLAFPLMPLRLLCSALIWRFKF